MSSQFADFADAMARPARPAPAAATIYRRVAVLGGGADARLLAAIALSEGAEVSLFSAYAAELEALRQAGSVALRGAGPQGSYQTDSDAAPSIRTNAELDKAVQGADLIVLTGPIHKQRTYAMVLADHLANGQTLLLPNARTFGALETRWLLSIGGCAADIVIAEAQGLPFHWVTSGSTLNLSAVSALSGGALPAKQDVSGLAALLPGFAPCISTVQASFADGSGLVEVPALVLGGPALPSGRPNVPMGGQPLPENNSFRNLLGAQHLDVVAALAEERREVARRYGVRDLPGTDDWLQHHAGAASGDGARAIPSPAEARNLIRDAAIGSLVPLGSAADLAGVPTPATCAMIQLASTLLGADLATAGRKLPAMGVKGPDADGARRQLMQLAGLN